MRYDDDKPFDSHLAVIQSAYDLINCSYTDRDIENKRGFVALFIHVLYSEYDWNFSKILLRVNPLGADNTSFRIPTSVFNILKVMKNMSGQELPYMRYKDIISIQDTNVEYITLYCTDLGAASSTYATSRFLEALKLKIAAHLALIELGDIQVANWCTNLCTKLLETMKYVESLEPKEVKKKEGEFI
jgi:hypothetical protein